MARGWRRPPSRALQSIPPGNDLELAADGFLDRNDGSRLEYEGGKHRTKFVNGQRIVAVHQHMPTPLANSHHEELDLEIGGRLPLTEYFEDSLLGMLVLHGRALRAFEPAYHILHWHSPRFSWRAATRTPPPRSRWGTAARPVSFAERYDEAGARRFSPEIAGPFSG